MHKWLNVPYDAAVIFSRDLELQSRVFQNNAAYLSNMSQGTLPFADLGPENSRRFRGLATWFTLMAYGAKGYQEIVDRNLATAKLFVERLVQDNGFVLLAPVRTNIVCFSLKESGKLPAFMQTLQRSQDVFLTSTQYRGQAGVRAAFVNWSTTDADVLRAVKACHDSLAAV